MQTMKAKELRAGMKFRRLMFGAPTTQEFFTVVRVERAQRRGYLIITVEGRPWISACDGDSVEVKS